MYPLVNCFASLSRGSLEAVPMRVILDMRKVKLRSQDRILFDVTDETTGRTISLPPQPPDLAFDSLQVTLMDILEQNRDSGLVPAIRPEADTTTALIKKTPV